jgi:hypothetical protein
MKKITMAVLLVVMPLFTFPAFADLAFKSANDVQGNWKLEYTKKSVSSQETDKREDSWAFNGNLATLSHIPREGIYYDQPPVPFVIEDGKLKISILGRPDKYDVFTLLEQDSNSMTVKGKFGDVYHFVKK